VSTEDECDPQGKKYSLTTRQSSVSSQVLKSEGVDVEGVSLQYPEVMAVKLLQVVVRG
jgi:hypothetical protein